MRVVAQPSAHFSEGGGLDGAGDGLVAEGGVPPWGKTGDVGVEVACVGMEEVGLARTEDRASAEIGVDEGATDEVRGICGGIGVGGCGVGRWGDESGIFKGEEGVWEEVNLTRGAGVTRDGGKNEVAPVVGEGGGNVEAPGPMTGPRGTNLGWVVGYDELSCRVDGVGGEIKGAAMDVVPC